VLIEGVAAIALDNRRDGAGVWSFVHVDDAAAATVAAIDAGTPGVHNIADDEPTRIAMWLPELAKVLDAKPPRHVPGWIGRIAAGEPGVYLSARVNGISNAKAKRELGWHPRYETWLVGFRLGLGETPIEPAAAAGAVAAPTLPGRV
jgi:nucleoside-diphosphate-sugar epimerase